MILSSSECIKMPTALALKINQELELNRFCFVGMQQQQLNPAPFVSIKGFVLIPTSIPKCLRIRVSVVGL